MSTVYKKLFNNEPLLRRMNQLSVYSTVQLINHFINEPEIVRFTKAINKQVDLAD